VGACGGIHEVLVVRCDLSGLLHHLQSLFVTLLLLDGPQERYIVHFSPVERFFYLLN
jgi:hypothetical protein